jgi:hypothetical protein
VPDHRGRFRKLLSHRQYMRRLAHVVPGGALGADDRLFADGGPVARFALAGSQAYSNGVVHLSYAPAAPGPESRQ